MPIGETPAFTETAAEIRYWRSLALDLDDELESVRAGTHDLENELQVDFEATERREAELKAAAERLRGELEDSKARHQTILREHAKTLGLVQRELEQVRSSEQTLLTKIRDMEVDNDDLEKSDRAKTSTLADMQERYHRALERTALLEEELVAKARLEEEAQRLKDELRDANEEMSIVRQQRDDLRTRSSRSPTLSTDVESKTGRTATTANSVETDTTPRKLADVKSQESEALDDTATFQPTVSPQKNRLSTSDPPVPPRVSPMQPSTSGSRAAHAGSNRVRDDFAAVKERILQQRRDKSHLPVPRSAPRRMSVAPAALTPLTASRAKAAGLASRSASHRLSAYSSGMTPPNGLRSPVEADFDESPLVSRSDHARRPPSRNAVLHTYAMPSSRPMSPSATSARSQTPSSALPRPPSSLGRPPSSLGRPSSALGSNRRKSGIPPPLPFHTGRPFSTAEPSSGHNSRRLSLKSPLKASGTPPPPVPAVPRWR